MDSSETSHHIGLLNEKSLHADLKTWCAHPGDKLEAQVDGFVIDIVCGDLLVEIQTGNFASIKLKLETLVANHPLRLVYPIASEKWIVKLENEGNVVTSRRKSPKRGRVIEVFNELVSFPELLCHPNFALEVLLIHEEEVRRYVGKRKWRNRGWAREDRRLLEVVEQRLFSKPKDLCALISGDLPEQFTTLELAKALGCSRRLAQKMAYCLRKMEVFELVGKRARSNLYQLTTS